MLSSDAIRGRPWTMQKGRICKEYIIHEEDGKILTVEPKRKSHRETGDLPESCRVIKAYKSKFIHTLVPEARRTVIQLDCVGTVFVQYTGLNNQPQQVEQVEDPQSADAPSPVVESMHSPSTVEEMPNSPSLDEQNVNHPPYIDQ